MSDSTAPTDAIIQAESGGDPNASNPNSSASGPGQFIDSTFLSVLKAHHPDIAQGRSDADLLGLKNDPTLGRQLTADYADDNGKALSAAGLPVTPGTTYLAHFAGPGGAVKILQADPSASAGDILGPAVLKANPFLQGMSAQGLQAWAAKKMGTPAPTVGPQSQPTQQAQAAPFVAPQQPAAPIFAPQPAAAPAFATAPPAPPIFAAPQQPAAPIFAPQPAAAPAFATAPPAPPIFAAQRKPIDLSALRAALAARAPMFPTSAS